MSETTENTINVETMLEFLKGKGLGVVVDLKQLASALNDVSVNSLRKFVYNGTLKTFKRQQNIIVLQLQDVAEWLVKYPEYTIPHRREMQEVTEADYENWNRQIRAYLRGSWNALLAYESADEIVSEVIVRIASRKKEMKSISTVIFRALQDIHRRMKRRIVTVPSETIENVSTEDEQDE